MECVSVNTKIICQGTLSSSLLAPPNPSLRGIHKVMKSPSSSDNRNFYIVSHSHVKSYIYIYIYIYISNHVKLYKYIYFYTYKECKSQTIYTHNIGSNLVWIWMIVKLVSRDLNTSYKEFGFHFVEKYFEPNNFKSLNVVTKMIKKMSYPLKGVNWKVTSSLIE